MGLKALLPMQQDYDETLLGIQGVKSLNNLGLFTSGEQINSLKEET